MPAGCGVEVVTGVVQIPWAFLPPGGHGPCVLARGARRVLKSTPAEAVVSLDAMVLLMMSRFRASSSEMPAPSQPATLLSMMLLVMLTEYQLPGAVGKLSTSEPLTFCSAMPPPVPDSAAL